MKVPAEYQIEFLGKVQRLLSDGIFTATYKYALLKAIADIAVESGTSDDQTLEISTRQLAEKFASYYWRQTATFPVESGAILLKQNSGKQAAVINQINAVRENYSGSIARAMKSAEWSKLVTRINSTVKQMPLWKLQTVGGQTDDFLYENVGRGDSITLRPNVAYCLRVFHGLISDLVQNAWLNFIRKTNSQDLGRTVELVDFLFGSERKSLMKLVEPLSDLQNGDCFYCGKRVSSEPDIDHFIPWSRYAVDLGHNFVMAHGKCNRSKSDHLASMDHLQYWVTFVSEHQDALKEVSDSAGFAHDFDGSLEIAQWAYGNAARVNGFGWHRKEDFRPIDLSFIEFF